MTTLTETNVRLFASSQSWIEEEALRQLYAAARLEGMRLAVGFPDLHPGKGTPVGAAFVIEDRLYPHLIGGDIGCGMALFKTNLVQRDLKMNRWSDIHFDLEHPWEGDVAEVLAESGLESTMFDSALGTLGGGNHFAELQAVAEVKDGQEFKQCGLGKQQLALLVHSGSYGLGETILQAQAAATGAEGVAAESFAAGEYLRGHDFAVRWAKVSRELIARRFATAIGAEAQQLWDGCHNCITKTEAGETAQFASAPALYVHRKGAVVADHGAVMIAGSRGSLSYLVKPLGEGATRAWSLAHGAGRKWARSETRLRIRERFSALELAHTGLGGQVICEERQLLYEEAPAAYKNIDAVVQDLVAAGLVSVIATFRPILTYKTRKLRR